MTDRACEFVWMLKLKRAISPSSTGTGSGESQVVICHITWRGTCSSLPQQILKHGPGSVLEAFNYGPPRELITVSLQNDAT
jgi:hypothetical protein